MVEETPEELETGDHETPSELAALEADPAVVIPDNVDKPDKSEES